MQKYGLKNLKKPFICFSDWKITAVCTLTEGSIIDKLGKFSIITEPSICLQSQSFAKTWTKESKNPWTCFSEWIILSEPPVYRFTVSSKIDTVLGLVYIYILYIVTEPSVCLKSQVLQKDGL